MKEARISVDFNEMKEDDLILLSKSDHKKDSQGNVVELKGGMLIQIFEEDYNEFNVRDDLLAGGRVELNTIPEGHFGHFVKWNCRIDELGIYHDSENSMGESK